MPTTVGRETSRLASGHRDTRIDRRIVPPALRNLPAWVSVIVRIGIVAGIAYLAMLAVSAFGRPYDFFDLKIYHGAVVWWAGGGELYQYIAPNITLGFTYPPFAALVMLPMAGLSTMTAGWMNLVVSLIALTVVLAALLVPIADRHGWSRWFTVAVALPVAAAIEPSRETLGYGQVNLLLFALIIGDLVALRWQARRGSRVSGNAAGIPGQLTVAARNGSAVITNRIAPGVAASDDPPSSDVPERDDAALPAQAEESSVEGAIANLYNILLRVVDRLRSTWDSWRVSPLGRLWFSGAWAGVGIGLATAVKLTPALFIVYLMVTKQWRAAMTACGTALGVTVFGFLLAGRESAIYFTSVMWQTGRVGQPDMTPNQSLAGLLARLYDSAETPGLLWLASALLMLAVGLSRASNAHREGDELAAFTLVGLTANVVSPISWTHHLVFVIPAVIILGDMALRRRRASRGLAARGVSAGVAAAHGLAVGQSLTGLRTPIWFPALTGFRHAMAAVGLYLLFLISPIWPYEHKFPAVSHYADGLHGALAENSLALALIVLVAALPWRPGAEPAFYAEPGLRMGRRP
jgi:hypothetical protein